MIALIDNYDSFTYNLAQLIESLGFEVQVFRNDKITVAELDLLSPSHMVISPGPGRPESAGVTMEAIKYFSKKFTPILGICLGHQAIAAAFGIPVILAPKAFHGKNSIIKHDLKGVFQNIPQNFSATRYHSLVVDKKFGRENFEFTCFTEDDIPMGIRHKSLPIEGLQFHPESYATEYGFEMMKNFFIRPNHE
ncbi:MAG: aminodeoxychorismate/anthranilate synthase component II [Bacteriovoracaceae bacterium]|nr:aminodeoxychorismate/anthranilate synthase component II [Bacteriovoracaceae bacterium]